MALGLVGCSRDNPQFGDGAEGSTGSSGSGATSESDSDGSGASSTTRGTSGSGVDDGTSSKPSSDGPGESSAGDTTGNPNTSGLVDTGEGGGSSGTDTLPDINCEVPPDDGEFVFLYKGDTPVGSMVPGEGDNGLARAQSSCTVAAEAWGAPLDGCNVFAPVLHDIQGNPVFLDDPGHQGKEVVDPSMTCVLSADLETLADGALDVQLDTPGIDVFGGFSPTRFWSGLGSEGQLSTCEEWQSAVGMDEGHLGRVDTTVDFLTSDGLPVPCDQSHTLLCVCWIGG